MSPHRFTKSYVQAKLVNDLEQLEILKEISVTQRNKLYVFKNYLDLFKA